MFLEQLNRITRRIPGALALSLVDRDGIPVESVSSNPDLDLEVLAAEMVTLARSVSDQYEEVGGGAFQQYTVATDRLVLVVSSISADYFLLLVSNQGSNLGRARFELRRARLLLEDELR